MEFGSQAFTPNTAQKVKKYKSTILVTFTK